MDNNSVDFSETQDIILENNPDPEPPKLIPPEKPNMENIISPFPELINSPSDSPEHSDSEPAYNIITNMPDLEPAPPDLKINSSEDINGLTHDQFKLLPGTNRIFGNYSQCEYCLKYYKKPLFTDEPYNGSSICFHCLFWLNYDFNLRQQVDGIFGKTIVQYILDYNQFHDKLTCTKSDNGGCFLCDYLNNQNIDGIINSELLVQDKPPEKSVVADIITINI